MSVLAILKYGLKLLLITHFLAASAAVFAAGNYSKYGEVEGIDFQNWAAGAAHIAGGVSPEDVAKTLGVSVSTWQKANLQWSKKLGQLMEKDLSVGQEYTDIFSNPKVGKFANSTAVSSEAELLRKVPSYDDFVKVMVQLTESGLPGEEVLKENGLTMQEWASLGNYYTKWRNNYLSGHGEENNKRIEELKTMYNRWTIYWSNYYEQH